MHKHKTVAAKIPGDSGSYGIIRDTAVLEIAANSPEPFAYFEVVRQFDNPTDPPTGNLPNENILAIAFIYEDSTHLHDFETPEELARIKELYSTDWYFCYVELRPLPDVHAARQLFR
ncbi:MAG: hypothetical protein NT141_01725 [candidate division WWE3 bacterium]|nr:hypothetical protein [candidate division WWE3 bacterium]